MMAKDLKEIMAKESDGSEAGSEEGEKGDEDNDSLFKLVRGEKAKGAKKRKVNFIVTLAGGGKDYVPSRWSSLMMTDQEGGDKFVPQRPRLADDSKASASEKRERSVSGEDLVVDRGDSSPAEEAKPRQKRKRTKKSKVGKSEEQEMQNEKGVSASDWVQSNPAVPDRAMSTPLTCDSAGVTPVQSAAALARSSDKPTWDTMRDYSDDVRTDKEWGLWSRDAVRTSRDEKMRGRSPPP
jgi:hypothetical protein